MKPRHPLLISGLLLVAACSGGSGAPDAPDPAVPCPLGDPAAPAMLEITHLDAAFQMFTTQPDSQVPLVFPPQGGWIFLLGARATNLDGCRVNITTSIRDVGGTTVLSLDRRPARLDDTGDGWGLTALSTYGNLPVCPLAAPTRDLHDQPYEVTVELDDADGKHAAKTITVTPVCPDPDPTGLCLCQCDQHYVLGSCPAPGG